MIKSPQPRLSLIQTKDFPFNRRCILLLIFVLFLLPFLYFNHFTRSHSEFVPRIVLRSSTPSNSLWRKVSIAHYTRTYEIRTDSHSPVFTSPLKEICEVIDPEDFRYADGVIVSLVDLVHLPTIHNDPKVYRKKYKNQLWLIHIEESPRNSYRSVQIKNITDLDDWFNLTATLRPESDIHIQYQGYRLKPTIGKIIEEKYNISLRQSFDHFPPPLNDNSTFLSRLTSALHQTYSDQVKFLINTCPYTCNKPLPNDILQLIKPHLPQLKLTPKRRDIVYIAWFVSNCHSHSGREGLVLELRSQPGIQVDIYGDCSSIFHSHIVPIQCKKGTPGCLEKTLKNYRFYLSFENSKCDGYITEKYWIQGTSGVLVPIVLGAKREQYRRIAVPNSYIHVDDYRNMKELAKELHRLNQNDTAYNEYLLWKQIYDVRADYTPHAGYSFHSTLCFLGHYQRLLAMPSSVDGRFEFLLKLIKNIFDLSKVTLPNFNWTTGKTKMVKISEFYNPKVNCWDNEYPSLLKRIYTHLFYWWKLF